MRYLILSDIHSNLEALEAVIAHAAGGYDEIVCCGDLVGYGADPNPVVEWVRENASVVVRGNHDKVCAGIDTADDFTPLAVASADWTRRQLTAESQQYLAGLQKGPVRVDGFHLIHGSPADEDQYLLDLNDAAEISNDVDHPLYFFGHTHVQGGFRFRGPRAGVISRRHPLALQGEDRHLVNPGAVGQPRDGDARAAYAIFEGRMVDFRRVPYDVGKAADKIRRAGLPDTLAARLFMGQ